MSTQLVSWLMTGWRRLIWSCFAMVMMILVSYPTSAETLSGAGKDVVAHSISASPSQRAAIVRSYLDMPLRFEANRGQTDSKVQFISRGAGYSLFLTPAEATFSLSSAAGKTSRLQMVMQGGDRSAVATGLERSDSQNNYFVGTDRSRWRTGVPDYARVRYKNLYPGIDLILYGNQRRLEYDFVVAPGADPRAIRLQFKNMRDLSLDAQGQLVIHTAAGAVRLDQPVVYQRNADGSRSVVQGSFAVARNRVHFKLGTYDRTRPLVIDPVVNYATFLGGSSNEDGFVDTKTGSYISNITVGPDGGAYVIGTTQSTDFPTSAGAEQTTAPGGLDIFVTKFNPAGSAIVYSTYLGGSNNDFPDGIAVDSTGNVYIAGSTASSNFPVTTGAIESTPRASNTGFVTKLNSSGTALVYSTYLGGTFVTELTGIAVDANNNAYVIGIDNMGFPTTTGALQTTVPGQENAVVAKLAVDGKSLVYSTYLGGENVDIARGLVVDAAGDAYVGGYTNSAHFPIVPATGTFQSTLSSTDGTHDGFIAKLNPTGTALIYSTYFGGTSEDQVDALALDSAGNVYITGLTTSTNLPLASAIQSTNGGGGDDAFVAKLSPTLSTLAYSTYLGGSNPDFATGIAIDSLGDAYVAGITGSTGGAHQFPQVNAIPLPQPGVLVTAAFVTEVNPAGSAFVYSTFFGGYEIVQATAMALDASGNVYITGDVTAPPFTATPGAYQQSLKGASDAYVTKLWPLSLSPAALAFPNTAVGSTSAPLTATLSNTGFATLNISSLAIATGDTGDFSETTTCGTTLLPQSSCTITVKFAPLSVAAFASTVSISDTAAPLPQIVTLTGTGTAASTTPQAVFTPTAINFGTQGVGTTSATQVAVLSNPGTGILNISNIVLTGSNPTFFGFTNGCGATLNPGASCSISINFTPPSANPFSAAISVTDNAASVNQSVSLAGTGGGPQETLTPSLVFAGLPIGSTSPTQTVMIGNTGNATLNLSGVALAGVSAGLFAISNNTCTGTILAGASCTLNISFTPNASGIFTAGLTVTSSNSGVPAMTTLLTGTGNLAPLPQAILTPTSLTFSSQTVGTSSAPQTIVLSNPGTATLNISGIAIASGSTTSYSLNSGCGSTLAAGASCNLVVVFVANTAGSLSATVSVTDNAANSPQSASLSGTGTAVSIFTVSSTTPAQSVQGGAVAQYNIVVAPLGGSYNNVVTLSATGLPPGSTSSFAPSTVTPGSTGAPTMLSIQTPVVLAKLVSPQLGNSTHVPLYAVLAWLPLLGLARRRLRRAGGRWMLLALVAFSILPMLSMTGCGGGYFGRVPQNFTIQVIGTSGSLQESTTVSLTVQ